MSAMPPTNDTEKGHSSFSSHPPSVNAPVHGEVEGINDVNETKLLRKIDLHVLPYICVMYLLAFLDRCAKPAVSRPMPVTYLAILA